MRWGATAVGRWLLRQGWAWTFPHPEEFPRRWHLLTTDVTGLRLMREYVAGYPTQELVGVVVPQNRLGTEKVCAVLAESEAAGLPWRVQPRGGRLPTMPRAAGVAVSWSYTQLLTREDLGRYPGGVLNFHGGALPAYAGAHALRRAMANGEPTIGCVWHEMVEAVDAGPVLAQSVIPTVEPFAVMRQRVFAEGRRLWPEAVRAFDARTRGGVVNAGATERHRGGVS